MKVLCFTNDYPSNFMERRINIQPVKCTDFNKSNIFITNHDIVVPPPYQLWSVLCSICIIRVRYITNMAEAVVDSRASSKFFCHKCSTEIAPVLPVKNTYDNLSV